jgi:hypothetical protein
MNDQILAHFSYNPITGVVSSKYRPVGYLESTGYIRIRFKKRSYQAHRIAWLIMTGELPTNGIDHVNRDKTDNRWCNLRTISHSDNCFNIGIRKNNKSGVIGVCWDKKRRKWNVTFGSLYLGTNGSLFEAACIRKSAENKSEVIF